MMILSCDSSLSDGAAAFDSETVVFSSAHGYGASGSSNSNGFVIPPYEPLIFELEILQDEEAE